MSDKLTLWQRCEALGPQNDQHVRLVRKHGETELGPCWIIYATNPIICIYQDRNADSDWLADAILSHFEGKKTLTVDEGVEWLNQWGQLCGTSIPLRFRGHFSKDADGRQKDNEDFQQALKSLEAQHHSTVKDPTEQQCADLFHFICGLDARKLDVLINGSLKKREIVVTQASNPKFGFSITRGSFYGFHPDKSCARVTFDEACAMVGFTPPPSSEPTQSQIRAVFNHVIHIDRNRAEILGLHYDHSRCLHDGSEEVMVYSRTPSQQWQITITKNSQGVYSIQSPFMFYGVCKIVGMKGDLPVPDTLENHTCIYVAESAKKEPTPAMLMGWIHRLATEHYTIVAEAISRNDPSALRLRAIMEETKP